MPKVYHVWKTKDFDRALPWLRAGLPVHEIASRLGVSTPAAYNKLRPYMKRKITAK